MTPPNDRHTARSSVWVGAWLSLATLSGCSTLSSSSSRDELPLFNKKPAIATTASKVAVPEMKLPPEWLTIESTVVSLGEQDLFDRIRYGFALNEFDYSAIDKEETWYANHPDYLDRTFRRGERYLYYIVSQLEARKMPLELALLPVVESAFNPTALSRAKAAGLWQFIPSTGQRFGLKQNLYYDGRRDVVESTRAALDYLQFLANEFNGDWLLAIAAYNAGEMNVARAVKRNQEKGLPTDFFSLDLPRETEAYVPKLLAMRRIVEDPASHGLEFGTLENQPYFVKVNTGGQIDLELAAQLAGMSQEDFLAINPGFKRRVTDPDGPHQLLIPVANEQSFLDSLASLPPEKRVPVVYYRVHKGDTLNKIAQRYGLSVAELRSMNHLSRNTVRVGQELLLRGATKNGGNDGGRSTSVSSSRVPATKTAVYTVRSGDNLWNIANRYDVDPNDLASYNKLDDDVIQPGQKLKIPGVKGNSNADIAQITYTVQHGDTLSDIARQFKVNVQQLMNWNKLSSAKSLRAGQQLVVYADDSRRSGG